MESVATLTMNPSLDLVLEVDKLVPGNKLRSKTVRSFPGGGGINVARVFHRFSQEIHALFPAGGSNGDRLIRCLNEDGISHEAMPVAAQTRESFVVHVGDADQHYHFVLPGPELRAEEAERCLQALQELEPAPRYLVASGSLPRGVDAEFYARVARFANGRDIRLILDTSGPPLTAALEEGVYLIKPNRFEFSELYGEKLASDEAARRDQIADVLSRGSMENLIVTLGDAGAMLATPRQLVHARPPRVDEVSTVGSGDSFVALLTLSLAQGKPLREALCWGVAGAAAATMTPGAELCHEKDVKRLFGQMQADENSVRVYDL